MPMHKEARKLERQVDYREIGGLYVETDGRFLTVMIDSLQVRLNTRLAYELRNFLDCEFPCGRTVLPSRLRRMAPETLDE